MSSKTIVEYVWIGGDYELRSKGRVMNCPVNSVNDLPTWNYDGSSTNQAAGHASEILITPRALFNDPFRGAPHKIVMCDTFKPSGEPALNNHRQWAANIFDQALDEEPWFGLEQEYFMMDSISLKPLGYGEDKKQGQFYCSAGSANAFGRELAEEHLRACIDAGLTISGINAEVAAGQWEFQIGPCVGIDQGDHLWMARYLLERVSEKHGVVINIEPKPLKGDWNGSGCHANYSTKNMREGTNDRTGLDFIYDAVDKLSRNHMEHMTVYGKNNDQRLSGAHETSPYNKFSVGIGNRGSSIRIGNESIRDKKGYFEDRRPGANCDPYLVTGMLFKTTVVDYLERTGALAETSDFNTDVIQVNEIVLDENVGEGEAKVERLDSEDVSQTSLDETVDEVNLTEGDGEQLKSEDVSQTSLDETVDEVNLTGGDGEQLKSEDVSQTSLDENVSEGEGAQLNSEDINQMCLDEK